MSQASVLPLASAALAGRVEPRLERMFRTHREQVCRTLRRLGMSPDAAADGTQQAFLVAMERLDHIRPGAERAYLFAAALRIANSARRRADRFQLEGNMDGRIDPEWQMDRMTNRQMALELMNHLLEHMDPHLMTVFVLFELQGMSTGAIAHLVGIPVGTAASRLRRARQAFRGAAGCMERSQGTQRKQATRGLVWVS